MKQSFIARNKKRSLLCSVDFLIADVIMALIPPPSPVHPLPRIVAIINGWSPESLFKVDDP